MRTSVRGVLPLFLRRGRVPQATRARGVQGSEAARHRAQHGRIRRHARAHLHTRRAQLELAVEDAELHACSTRAALKIMKKEVSCTMSEASFALATPTDEQRRTRQSISAIVAPAPARRQTTAAAAAAERWHGTCEPRRALAKKTAVESLADKVHRSRAGATAPSTHGARRTRRRTLARDLSHGSKIFVGSRTRPACNTSALT